VLLVQANKNHKNDRNGVGIGHKQARKEEEFEVGRSSSNYKRILIVDDEPDDNKTANRRVRISQITVHKNHLSRFVCSK
jgi:hypothetical protein